MRFASIFLTWRDGGKVDIREYEDWPDCPVTFCISSYYESLDKARLVGFGGTGDGAGGIRGLL
jgi:hypothetical protein